MRSNLFRLLTMTAVLGVIAWLAPVSKEITDIDTYDRISQQWFIPGCDDVHCFRVLTAWLLGVVPLASMIKWRAAAAVCEAGAALLMGKWAQRLGAPPTVARQVMLLALFGQGALYTLFDPHTSDPMIHMLVPALMLWLVDGRLVLATAVGAVGVLAKEFAVVPFYITAIWWWLQGRPHDSRRAAVAAAIVTSCLLAWQIGLRVFFGYTTGANPSANLLAGGYLSYWLHSLEPHLIVLSMVMTIGALWVLWPAGAWWGPPTIRQLTLAALPCMLVLCYVQQPDRAVWNFAFVVLPAAAVILARSSPMVGWGIVVAQAMANLRIGAQLAFVPGSKFGFVVALLLTLVACWQARSFRTAQSAAA